MKKNSKKIVFGVCLLIFIACVSYIIYYYVGNAKREKVYDDLKKKATEESIETDGNQETDQLLTAEASTEKDKKVPKKNTKINIEELRKTNPDIYAWVEIPDTQIQYPILQHSTDDSYYLYRTVEGEEGYPGSIYTENCNAKDFSDFNTVVYGHNMRDGSMFRGLHNFKDPQYLEEHPYIYVYTEEEVLTYKIFAACSYDDYHMVKNYDYKEDSERQRLLGTIPMYDDGDSHLVDGVKVTTEDKILTLLTCITGRDGMRYIVSGIQVEE